MTIQKKSLIRALQTTKKANLAKDDLSTPSGAIPATKSAIRKTASAKTGTVKLGTLKVASAKFKM